MAKYRKKPVVVEATQWFKNGNHPGDYIGHPEGPVDLNWEGRVVRRYRVPELDGQDKCQYCSDIMHNHGWIDTVQGGHIVCPGDFIITDDRVGVEQHGHYYPCKPNIFAATYGPVPETPE